MISNSIPSVQSIQYPSWAQRGLLLLLALFFYSHSWQTADKPKIKKEVVQVFEWVQQEKNLRKYTETEYNRAGKVVQFSEYKGQGQEQGALRRLKINRYDTKGRFLGSMLYDSAQALIQSEELRLDEDGQVLQKKLIDYSQNPSFVQEHLYEYNQEGLLLFQQYYESQRLLSEKRMTYSEFGEVLRQEQWFYEQDSTGKERKKVVQTDYLYDELGYLEKSIKDYQIGRKKWREERVFRKNFLISLTLYKQGKRVSHFAVPQRDSSKIHEEYYLETPQPYPDLEEWDFIPPPPRDPMRNIPHTLLREVSLTYNDNEQLLRKAVREEEQVVEVTFYSYDEQKNLVEERKEDRLRLRDESTLYEYDDYSNLVRKVFYENGYIQREEQLAYEYYQ